MNKSAMVPAVLLFVISSVYVLAHENATGIVKERMDAMASVAASMKSIASMIRETSPFDRHTAMTEVQNIKAHSGDNLTRLFPDGSVQDVSEAKPEIWSDWNEFEALAQQMAFQAESLEQILDRKVDGDAAPGELGSAFRKLAKTCSQCHAAYRLSK